MAGDISTLSTQVDKWVPENLIIILQWTSIASSGVSKYSTSLYATETAITSSLMGHLARMQTFTWKPAKQLDQVLHFPHR